MAKDLKFNVNGNHFVHDGGFESLVTFVTEAEKLGYDNIRLVDHVVGIVAAEHPDLPPTPYTHKSEFQEVFTFMSYLSAITTRIGFLTGVLGLPQRQTALVAKQAAQVDYMSKGRLTLGIGIGYNHIEFEAMGEEFKTRGARVEEQVDVLRALWTQDVVNFTGKWHTLRHVNVNPLPVQRPIPIWMGAGRLQQPVPPPKVVERIAKYADGFMPLFRINEETLKLEDDALASLAEIRSIGEAAGRDMSGFQLEISIYPEGKSEERVLEEIAYLDRIGTTHVHARFPNSPLDEQLVFLKDFAATRDRYLASR
jgi:probable F420-dependent oxidoreductase